MVKLLRRGIRNAGRAALWGLTLWLPLVTAGPTPAEVAPLPRPVTVANDDCIGAPTRTCVLTMARRLADTPGVLAREDRERFETTIAYAMNPERLLATAPPSIEFPQDGLPTTDWTLLAALVANDRFNEATSLLSRWTGQFERHRSSLFRAGYGPRLTRALATVSCLQSDVATCAASFRQGFRSYAMIATDPVTLESTAVGAELRPDKLLAHMARRGRLDDFIAVLRAAELSPTEMIEAVYDSFPFSTLAEIGLLRLGQDGRWADWRPVLTPFAELLYDAWTRTGDDYRAKSLSTIEAPLLFWAHAVLGKNMEELIAAHGRHRATITNAPELCILVSRAGLMASVPRFREHIRDLVHDSEHKYLYEPTERLFCDEDLSGFERAMLADFSSKSWSVQSGSIERFVREPRFPNAVVVPILDRLLDEANEWLGTIRGGWDHDGAGDGPGPREAIRKLIPLRAFRTGEIDSRTPLPDRERATLVAHQTIEIILGHLYRGDRTQAADAFRHLDPTQRLAFVSQANLENEQWVQDEFNLHFYAALYGLPPVHPAQTVGLIALLPDPAEKAQLLAAWLKASVSRPSLVDPPE